MAGKRNFALMDAEAEGNETGSSISMGPQPSSSFHGSSCGQLPVRQEAQEPHTSSSQIISGRQGLEEACADLTLYCLELMQFDLLAFR